MTYFEKPKQVVFADPENPGDWLCGIAFRDAIICSCCGGVFEINEVVELAKEDGVINPIYSYEDWSDLTDDLCGGVLPEGLQFSGDDSAPGIIETAVAAQEYEQHYFILEEEEEEAAAAVDASVNTPVSGAENSAV